MSEDVKKTGDNKSGPKGNTSRYKGKGPHNKDNRQKRGPPCLLPNNVERLLKKGFLNGFLKLS